MSEKIHLLRDLLLVRKIEQKLISSGGIWLPSNEDNDEPIFWDVLEVGKQVTDVKPGDKIVTHNKTLGQEYFYNGEKCLIIRWKYVFGVFDKDTNISVY